MRAIVLISAVLFLAACGGDDPHDVLRQGGATAGGQPASSEVQAPILSDDQAKKMIDFKCTVCHPTTRIKNARYTKVEWEARIQKCKEKPSGAKISPIDAESLANWLSRKYGR